MKYDDASWHFEATDFGSDRQIIDGYTHISFFVQWLFEKNLLNDEMKSQIITSGNQDFRENFKKIFDGKFAEDDLIDNACIRDIISRYYEENYFKFYTDNIYDALKHNSIYDVENTSQNYLKVKNELDKTLLKDVNDCIKNN